MKNQSDRHTISAEVIAAYLDGNATAAESCQILAALKDNMHLRELLNISLTVDKEMGFQHSQQAYLPMTAMAAECTEGNYCCLECEKYVLKKRSIAYNEQELTENALQSGWLKEQGIALHNVGRILEQHGLIVVRQYECNVQDIVDALQAGDDVIVAVDGGELIGDTTIERLEDTYIGNLPDHAVVVVDCDVTNDRIILFDPNSEHPQDQYSIAQFMNAWADAANYLVTIKNVENMNNYNPKPIDVSDVQLNEDLIDLREAIAENAHNVWAANRMAEGWTCGPRDDEKKQNPCLVPYSKLPEVEKEYDRAMAMQTIKLMKKLGYDLVKREDTELYRELLMRLRNADQTFYCPCCMAKGKKTPVYKRQIFCDVCGHELNIDWSLYD